MFVRVTRCVEQTHLEAVKATSATFRLVLQSFHLLQPSIVVVVSIHNLKSKRLRIARALVLAYEVLLLRVDVGIAIIDDRCDAVLKQALYDGRTARRAAGVQQDTIGTVWGLNGEWHRHFDRVERIKIIDSIDIIDAIDNIDTIENIGIIDSIDTIAKKEDAVGILFFPIVS